jgi:hypothetical protein
VRFTNELAFARAVTNQNLLNGAGVAAGDFDGDGWCDLYFCNLEGPNALLRNQRDGRFADVTAVAGAACAHQASRGAAFADVDGDGWPDLVVTSALGPNALLRNDGEGRFTDVTAQAGLVVGSVGSASLALADLDGDGDLDIYIANNGDNSVLRSGGQISIRMVNGKPVVSGRYSQRLRIVGGLMVELGPPDALFLNDGKGRFTAASWTGGLFLDGDGRPLKQAPRDLGLSVMLRDLNGDGLPDIYVCNDFQTPDRIWLQDGRGHFRALPDAAIRTTPQFSMAVDVGDLDRDGFDDIVLSDMLSRFHRLRLTQIGAPSPSPDEVGEATERFQAHRNVFLHNRGDGTYADLANYAGLDASDWTWAVALLDVDLDGYEDLLVTTGHAVDTQDLDTIERSAARDRPMATTAGGMRGAGRLGEFPPLRTPNCAFRNRGDLTFQEVGAVWGFNATDVSHGLALCDIDNDGDLDVAVNCLGSAALIYRNESVAPRVAVRLRGRAPNAAGIGARIVVRGGAVPVQSQEMIAGGRYVSSDQPQRVFAAGSKTNRLSIEVAWRSGRRSVVADARPNYIYEIDEGAASEPVTQPDVAPGAAVPQAAEPRTLFKDVSQLLAHTHQELPFDDFERQPLLPKRLSGLGPRTAWFDLDGDGHDDLFLGAGRGSALAAFRGDGRGGLAPWPGAFTNWTAPDDVAGIAGWAPPQGPRVLLAALTRYESDVPEAGTVLAFASDGAAPRSVLPARLDASPGPIGLADIDGDGSLDLFVGGRVIAGRYPEPASSRLYRAHGGKFEIDEPGCRALEHAGLVSGAVFTDLDGDGLPELVAACEWGPLKLFRNRAGRFEPWDPPVAWASPPGPDAPQSTAGAARRAGPGSAPPGPAPAQGAPLSSLLGLWQCVGAGDFDGDGRMDLVAGNWGLNSSYHQPSLQEPIRLYYGDFAGRGSVDTIEAYVDPDSRRVVPRRGLSFLGAGWPGLRARFATHAALAVADIDAVLGEQSGRARVVRATGLASVVLLNRGDRFDVVPLPAEAQFAPVLGVNIADADGDGHEDIFLAQNFFDLPSGEPRLDAGRGLWLRGDGAGQFAPIPGQESGVAVYGEQRGSALADFDEDGRVDLVVTQRGAATRLFRNERARPGLRVRLAGPAGNPQGVGAAVRLLFGDRPGPMREVQAGLGSQDSAVLVLAAPEQPTALWVRWPGGRITTTPIPAGAKSVAAHESTVPGSPGGQ